MGPIIILLTANILAEANRLRMLNMLSSIRYDEKHRKLQRMRQEGTGLWLFKTNTFMEWSASTKSCCLYCYGMPGSGKSVLTLVLGLS